MNRRLPTVVAALIVAGIHIACWPARLFGQEQAAPPARPALVNESPSEAAIREELAKETTLELSDKSLEMAAKYLQQKHHIEIILDQEATKAVGVDPSAIVSIDAHGIALRSALRLLLAPLNLTYVVKDEVLQITTKDKAGTELVTEVYDVRDLVSPEGTDDRDFDSLIGLLTAIVSPPSWSDKGGLGSCQPGPLGTLVVLQSQEIQAEISDLLAALRLGKAQSKAGKFDEPILVGARVANKKIEMLLADKIDLNLDALSLKDVFSQIGKQKNLPVWIDQEALKQAGIDPAATLIVKSLSGISLKSALKLILQDFNLTTVIKDEVLQVTTKDKAGSELSVRLYPIGDLVAQATDEYSSADAATSLVDNISSTVRPESWTEKGGQGSIEPYGVEQPVLVIAQTDEAQYGVADLLAQLREVRRRQRVEAAQAQKDQPATEKLVLKIYPIRNHDNDPSAMTPQEVAEAVQGLVQPGSWSLPEIYIRGFTGKLVVRQTPAIHREIDKLLDKIEAKPPKPSGGGGGGF
jgi:hypothetical protein